MNFEDWISKNIHSYLSKETISFLEKKYLEDKKDKKDKKEKKKYEDWKDHNYIWELFSIYLDPFTILKCGEVCWEWYRWSRANITWLSKRNKLIALFPELLSLIDKDTKDNNHNTRMIKIIKNDVPKWNSRGCNVYVQPTGIYRLYSKVFLPIIQKRNFLNLKRLNASSFVPILVSLYRHSSFYRTLDDNEIINISSEYREKRITIRHKKVVSEIVLNTYLNYTEDFVKLILNIL